MKKILLTAAAAAVLSTSSAYAAEDMFYVKLNGGWSKLTKTQGAKSKNDAFFGVGAGYYVMDNARVDLTFDHFFNPSFKASQAFALNPAAAARVVATTTAKTTATTAQTDATTAKTNATAELTRVNGIVPPVPADVLAATNALAAANTALATANTNLATANTNLANAQATPGAIAAVNSVKIKGTVNSLLLNGYVDLFDVDAFKFFVGAGVGMSQVSAKVTFTINNISRTVKLKNKNNLAFAGYVGASYEFTPGVSGEVTYSYRDMGKTKKLGGTSAAFKGHHVGAGVRFDI